MTRSASRAPRGFTLTEMLVVIAIIVVLAAILFPVLSRVQRNARKVQCIANLHALGVAMGMYTSDHNNYFPNWCASHPNPMSPPTPKNAPGTGIVTWDMMVADYLKDVKDWKQMVVCPDWPREMSGVMGPGATAEKCRSYALARQTQRPSGVNFYGGYKAMIPNPAKTVMIFEKGANLPGSWGDALGENVYQSHGTKADPASGYTEQPFHFEGKNILFVDGNVKWFLKGTGPYAWNPAGSNGAGACERWGVENKTTPALGGDWPPLD